MSEEVGFRPDDNDRKQRHFENGRLFSNTKRRKTLRVVSRPHSKCCSEMAWVKSMTRRVRLNQNRELSYCILTVDYKPRNGRDTQYFPSGEIA